MTEESNIKPQEQTSLVEGQLQNHIENLSDSERRAKYGNNGSRKSALSKREMMEELSRERFPWEE